MTPRRIAHSVLVRVLRDQAFADRALDSALSRASLEDRDRALATELVYGSLRHTGYLDFLLQKLASKQPLHKLPHGVLTALRLGAYQLLFTRVPDYSAVDEMVTLSRESSPRLAGFTNGVLRQLARLRESGTLPDPYKMIAQPLQALATATSHPLWMIESVAKQLGPEQARQWAEHNNQSPPLSLRINRLKISREAYAARLTEAGYEVEIPAGFPDTVWIRGAGSVPALPGYDAGEFVVQDAAATLVGYLAAPEPGSFTLDVCAAPGGKSTHLGELTGDQGTVLATDVHPGKARLIAENAQRLGLKSVHAAVLDATDVQAIAALLQHHKRREVDLAVIDAPCSGLGTLRRNPELRGRRAADLEGLCALQDRILDAVCTFVKPGGSLVYALCTTTQEEGPERIQAFLQRHHDWSLETPTAQVLAPFVEHQDSLAFVRTWPHLQHSDGFFAARFRKKT